MTWVGRKLARVSLPEDVPPELSKLLELHGEVLKEINRSKTLPPRFNPRAPRQSFFLHSFPEAGIGALYLNHESSSAVSEALKKYAASVSRGEEPQAEGAQFVEVTIMADTKVLIDKIATKLDDAGFEGAAEKARRSGGNPVAFVTSRPEGFAFGVLLDGGVVYPLDVLVGAAKFFRGRRAPPPPPPSRERTFEPGKIFEEEEELKTALAESLRTFQEDPGEKVVARYSTVLRDHPNSILSRTVGKKHASSLAPMLADERLYFSFAFADPAKRPFALNVVRILDEAHNEAAVFLILPLAKVLPIWEGRFKKSALEVLGPDHELSGAELLQLAFLLRVVREGFEPAAQSLNIPTPLPAEDEEVVRDMLVALAKRDADALVEPARSAYLKLFKDFDKDAFVASIREAQKPPPPRRRAEPKKPPPPPRRPVAKKKVSIEQPSAVEASAARREISDSLSFSGVAGGERVFLHGSSMRTLQSVSYAYKRLNRASELEKFDAKTVASKAPAWAPGLTGPRMLPDDPTDILARDPENPGDAITKHSAMAFAEMSLATDPADVADYALLIHLAAKTAEPDPTVVFERRRLGTRELKRGSVKEFYARTTRERGIRLWFAPTAIALNALAFMLSIRWDESATWGPALFSLATSIWADVVAQVDKPIHAPMSLVPSFAHGRPSDKKTYAQISAIVTQFDPFYDSFLRTVLNVRGKAGFRGDVKSIPRLAVTYVLRAWVPRAGLSERLRDLLLASQASRWARPDAEPWMRKISLAHARASKWWRHFFPDTHFSGPEGWDATFKLAFEASETEEKLLAAERSVAMETRWMREDAKKERAAAGMTEDVYDTKLPFDNSELSFVDWDLEHWTASGRMKERPSLDDDDFEAFVFRPLLVPPANEEGPGFMRVEDFKARILSFLDEGEEVFGLGIGPEAPPLSRHVFGREDPLKVSPATKVYKLSALEQALEAYNEAAREGEKWDLDKFVLAMQVLLFAPREALPEEIKWERLRDFDKGDAELKAAFEESLKVSSILELDAKTKHTQRPSVALLFLLALRWDLFDPVFSAAIPKNRERILERTTPTPEEVRELVEEAYGKKSEGAFENADLGIWEDGGSEEEEEEESGKRVAVFPSTDSDSDSDDGSASFSAGRWIVPNLYGLSAALQASNKNKALQALDDSTEERDPKRARIAKGELEDLARDFGGRLESWTEVREKVRGAISQL